MLLAAATQQQANPLVGLLPFLLIGVLLYFMMIRPQKRRMQQQKLLLDELEVGDEVLTVGGIFGTIRHMDEDGDEMTIEVAPGTTLRIVRSAVARRVTEEEDIPDEEDDSWADESQDGTEEQ